MADPNSKATVQPSTLVDAYINLNADVLQIIFNKLDEQTFMLAMIEIQKRDIADTPGEYIYPKTGTVQLTKRETIYYKYLQSKKGQYSDLQSLESGMNLILLRILLSRMQHKDLILEQLGIDLAPAIIKVMCNRYVLDQRLSDMLVSLYHQHLIPSITQEKIENTLVEIIKNYEKTGEQNQINRILPLFYETFVTNQLKLHQFLVSTMVQYGNPADKYTRALLQMIDFSEYDMCFIEENPASDLKDHVNYYGFAKYDNNTLMLVDASLTQNPIIDAYIDVEKIFAARLKTDNQQHQKIVVFNGNYQFETINKDFEITKLSRQAFSQFLRYQIHGYSPSQEYIRKVLLNSENADFFNDLAKWIGSVKEFVSKSDDTKTMIEVLSQMLGPRGYFKYGLGVIPSSPDFKKQKQIIIGYLDKMLEMIKTGKNVYDPDSYEKSFF
jgi:hypothetical protein